MSAWSAGASQRPRAAHTDLGAASTSTQAQLTGRDDLLDEEVGALTNAVGKLKGLVTAIGEESRETGKIQDAVAKQLESAQGAMNAGVKKMKRMHREMTSSCGHMLVLAIYAVALILGVVFLSRVKAVLGWLLSFIF